NTDNILLRCRATFPSGEGFRIVKRSLHSKTFPYNDKPVRPRTVSAQKTPPLHADISTLPLRMVSFLCCKSISKTE
ncbi:MAG: hypothetical protein IIV05_05960, partial [Ruminococcus sp.]|nr:hypothetical protein [Ruminococcus sp.]